MEEPSVLDYLKSKINPWAAKKISIPNSELSEESKGEESWEEFEEEYKAPVSKEKSSFPWRSILALIFAVIAQFALEPPVKNKNVAIFLYTFSFGFLVWAIIREGWIEKIQSKKEIDPMQQDVLLTPLILSLVFATVTFLAFGGYQFNIINTFMWLLSILFLTWSVWTRKERAKAGWQKIVSIFNNHVLIIKNCRVTE